MLSETAISEDLIQKKSSSQQKTTLFLILIISLGFITTFLSGYMLGELLTQEKNQQFSPCPSPNPIASDKPQEQESTLYVPGKFYFDDTIIVITQDPSPLTLIATATRSEREENYLQTSRVSFFDGKNWIRKIATGTNNNSAIASNDVIKNWTTIFDPSKVLKQSVTGAIDIDGTSISFSTATLENEIGIRSIPGYTKFMSSGVGSLTIDGVVHKADILYTRIYSLNAEDIQAYDQSLNLTTDFIVFWDDDGNFYHIDTTSVANPTLKYQSHQIGVIKNSLGAVQKTFSVSITRDQQNPPTHYEASFNTLNTILNFDRITAINKSPSGDYVWYMGTIEGTVKTSQGKIVSGHGLVEYISR